MKHLKKHITKKRKKTKKIQLNHRRTVKKYDGGFNIWRGILAAAAATSAAAHSRQSTNIRIHRAQPSHTHRFNKLIPAIQSRELPQTQLRGLSRQLSRTQSRRLPSFVPFKKQSYAKPLSDTQLRSRSLPKFFGVKMRSAPHNLKKTRSLSLSKKVSKLTMAPPPNSPPKTVTNNRHDDEDKRPKKTVSVNLEDFFTKLIDKGLEEIKEKIKEKIKEHGKNVVENMFESFLKNKINKLNESKKSQLGITEDENNNYLVQGTPLIELIKSFTYLTENDSENTSEEIRELADRAGKLTKMLIKL